MTAITKTGTGERTNERTWHMKMNEQMNIWHIGRNKYGTGEEAENNEEAREKEHFDLKKLSFAQYNHIIPHALHRHYH